MPDVPIRFVDRIGTVPRAERTPGDAKWATHPDPGKVSLLFVCPCGCGDIVTVAASSVAGGDTEDSTGRPCWHWNGDREHPTLTPSIQYALGCRWHGWLRGGVFVGA